MCYLIKCSEMTHHIEQLQLMYIDSFHEQYRNKETTHIQIVGINKVFSVASITHVKQ